MDYNATTPLEPEVIQAMTEAMWEAWGNPSSPYPAGNSRRCAQMGDSGGRGTLRRIAHHVGLLGLEKIFCSPHVFSCDSW